MRQRMVDQLGLLKANRKIGLYVRKAAWFCTVNQEII